MYAILNTEYDDPTVVKATLNGNDSDPNIFVDNWKGCVDQCTEKFIDGGGDWDRDTVIALMEDLGWKIEFRDTTFVYY